MDVPLGVKSRGFLGKVLQTVGGCYTCTCLNIVVSTFVLAVTSFPEIFTLFPCASCPPCAKTCEACSGEGTVVEMK